MELKGEDRQSLGVYLVVLKWFQNSWYCRFLAMSAALALNQYN